MAAIIYMVLILLVFIFQSFFSGSFIIEGVKPDLLLAIVVIIAVNHGKRKGALSGLVIGLLEDLFFGGLIGVNAISKLLTGLAFGFLKKYIYQYIFLLTPIFVFLATIFNQLIILALLNQVLLEISIGQLFNELIFPLGAYNAVFSLPIYCLIYIIDFYINRRRSSVK